MGAIEHAGYNYKFTNLTKDFPNYPYWTSAIERMFAGPPGFKILLIKVQRIRLPRPTSDPLPVIIDQEHSLYGTATGGGTEYFINGTRETFGDIEKEGQIWKVLVPMSAGIKVQFRLKWRAMLKWPNTTFSEQEWDCGFGASTGARGFHIFASTGYNKYVGQDCFTYVGDSKHYLWPTVSESMGEMRFLNWSAESAKIETFSVTAVGLNNASGAQEIKTLPGKAVGIFSNNQSTVTLEPQNVTALRFRIEPNTADYGVLAITIKGKGRSDMAVVPVQSPKIHASGYPRISIRDKLGDNRNLWGATAVSRIGHRIELYGERPLTKKLVVQNDDNKRLVVQITLAGVCRNTNGDFIGGTEGLMPVFPQLVSFVLFPKTLYQGNIWLNPGEAYDFGIELSEYSGGGAIFINASVGVGDGITPGTHLLIPVIATGMPEPVYAPWW